MTEWMYTIWYGSVFSPAAPLVFATQAKPNRSLLVIVAFVLFSMGSDLLTTFVTKGNNYQYLMVYGLIESMLLMYFYSLVIHSLRRHIRLLSVCYAAFYIISSFFIEADSFNGLTRAVECLVMISLSLLLFFEFYRREEDIFIERTPNFWFNVALLTYFGGAFFSFILIKELMKDNAGYWVLHNLSNILKNGLLAIGLWRSR